MRLRNDFGKGFDITNPRNMRRVFWCFPNRDVLRLELGLPQILSGQGLSFGLCILFITVQSRTFELQCDSLGRELVRFEIT